MGSTQGSPNATEGPPFTTGQDITCFFAVADSNRYHGGPNGSLYEVDPTLVEISPPFVFLEQIPFETSCPPGGCTFTEVGLEFQLPSQPGTYNVEFTILYTWVYLNPP